MLKNLVTLEAAQFVLRAVRAALPDLPPPALKIIDYGTSFDLNDNGRRPYAIVWPNGFHQDVYLLDTSIRFNGNWASGLRREYYDYCAGHQEAMPGTDEWLKFVDPT